MQKTNIEIEAKQKIRSRILNGSSNKTSTGIITPAKKNNTLKMKLWSIKNIENKKTKQLLNKMKKVDLFINSENEPKKEINKIDPAIKKRLEAIAKSRKQIKSKKWIKENNQYIDKEIKKKKTKWIKELNELKKLDDDLLISENWQEINWKELIREFEEKKGLEKPTKKDGNKKDWKEIEEKKEDLGIKYAQQSVSKSFLNYRQMLFCKYYTSTEFFWNWVQSYCMAYWYDILDIKENQRAKVKAWILLKKPNVLAYLNSILEKWWLNDIFVDTQLLFLITQNVDFSNKLGAIREFNKLKWRITDKAQVEHTGTISLVALSKEADRIKRERELKQVEIIEIA